jgi:hypothetical protein
MGEWKTVFDGEIEGRPVTVKVYESEVDEDEDAEPAVRVTTTSLADDAGAFEPNEDGQTLFASTEPPSASITLDPAAFSDLEEELIEVGFSWEAAAHIVRTVPR